MDDLSFRRKDHRPLATRWAFPPNTLPTPNSHYPRLLEKKYGVPLFQPIQHQWLYRSFVRLVGGFFCRPGCIQYHTVPFLNRWIVSQNHNIDRPSATSAITAATLLVPISNLLAHCFGQSCTSSPSLASMLSTAMPVEPPPIYEIQRQFPFAILFFTFSTENAGYRPGFERRTPKQLQRPYTFTPVDLRYRPRHRLKGYC